MGFDFSVLAYPLQKVFCVVLSFNAYTMHKHTRWGALMKYEDVSKNVVETKGSSLSPGCFTEFRIILHLLLT